AGISRSTASTATVVPYRLVTWMSSSAAGSAMGAPLTSRVTTASPMPPSDRGGEAIRRRRESSPCPVLGHNLTRYRGQIDPPPPTRQHLDPEARPSRVAMNVAPDEGTAYLPGASCGRAAMQTAPPDRSRCDAGILRGEPLL